MGKQHGDARRCGRYACAMWLGLTLAGGCTSSDDEAPANADLCLQLRAHVIEVRLSGMTNVDVAAHRAAFESSLGDDFVDACGKAYSIRQVKCALATADPEALEACTHSTVAAAP